MIVEFTIKNYRSIKNEHTFSFYAGDYKTETHAKEKSELPNNITFMPKGNDKGGMALLNVAAIYGANASGKSNILMAFDVLVDIVRISATFKEPVGIPFYDPYKLCKKTKSEPSLFRMKFFCNITGFDKPILCDYKVEFDSKHILSECLFFYPKNTPAELFSKTEKQNWETMKIGNYVKGKKRRVSFHHNASYLSSIGRDAAAPQILKDIFLYLVRSVNYVAVNGSIQVRQLMNNEKLVETTERLLDLFDTGITKLSFKKNNLTTFLEQHKGLAQVLDILPKEDHIREQVEEQLLINTLFLHKGSDHSEYISEENISSGTRRLFDFLPVLLFTFKDGKTLLVDELETKFHPHIAKLIIKLFNDERVNRKGAQLIFSTHSTELMDNDLLRRDQIWFTEKDQGETVLFSLADFNSGKVRCHSPFAKWYLDGRFGAIPQFNYLEIADLFVGLGKLADKDSIND